MEQGTGAEGVKDACVGVERDSAPAAPPPGGDVYRLVLHHCPRAVHRHHWQRCRTASLRRPTRSHAPLSPSSSTEPPYPHPFLPPPDPRPLLRFCWRGPSAPHCARPAARPLLPFPAHPLPAVLPPPLLSPRSRPSNPSCALPPSPSSLTWPAYPRPSVPFPNSH